MRNAMALALVTLVAIGCADSTGVQHGQSLFGAYSLTHYLGMRVPYVQEYTTADGVRRRDTVDGASIALREEGGITAVWRGTFRFITGPDAGGVTAYADTFHGSFAYSAGSDGRGAINVYWTLGDNDTQWQPLFWRAPELLHFQTGMSDTTRFIRRR
jgi:hypothetical protein